MKRALHRKLIWRVANCLLFFANHMVWTLSRNVKVNILFSVEPSDIENGKFWHRLETFAQERGVANAFMTNEGHILLSSTDRKLKLNSGMKTLQLCLDLTYAPSHITSIQPLPQKFIQEYFHQGYDPGKIAQRFGKLFEDASIRTIVNDAVIQSRNRARNRTIVENDTDQLVRERTVSVENARCIEESKKLIKRLEREKKLNPDLEGPYEMTFEQWTWNRETKMVIRTGVYPPRTVLLEGLPGRTDVKFKHYYA